jgi:hypothetical protein
MENENIDFVIDGQEEFIAPSDEIVIKEGDENDIQNNTNE